MNTPRKLYTVSESYGLLYDAANSMKHMVRERKSKNIQPEFLERIMLAVTEVNSCPMCFYAHTKIALDAGMNGTEIENMLQGVLDDVPTEELPAIMFAQHYADTRGKPSKESLRTLVNVYGLKKAQGILGGIRAIMVGNAYGIPWGSLINRFKGNPDPRSHLGYEIAMVITLFPFILISLLHSLIMSRPKLNPSQKQGKLTR